MRLKTAIKIGLALGFAALVLSVFGIGYLVSSLASGYEIRGEKVLFRKFDNVKWKLDRTEVRGADPAKFETVPRSGGNYGVDSKSAYFQDNPIADANPTTFRVLDWRQHYSRDEERVFWQSIMISRDAEHFEVLDRGYARDQTQVYYGSQVVDGADPMTFVVDGTATSHAHDKEHQYNMGRRIDEPRIDR